MDYREVLLEEREFEDLILLLRARDASLFIDVLETEIRKDRIEVFKGGEIEVDREKQQPDKG